MASLHGHEIATELELEGACAASGPRGTLRVERLDGDSPLDASAELTALRLDPDGAPTFAIGRQDRGPIVWDRGRGCFAVDAGAGIIEAAPSGQPAGWSHLVATVVVPLLLVERGELALHASSVLGADGAVLFCGPSGRGKSTAALLASDAGAPVLSDDAAVIGSGDGALATWSGGTRLWVDDGVGSRAARRSVAVDASGPGPFPIAAIVVLDERGNHPLARRLGAVEALPELVPCLVHAGGPDPLRASFTRLAAALEAIPAWSVSLPDGLSAGQRAIGEALETVAGRA